MFSGKAREVFSWLKGSEPQEKARRKPSPSKAPAEKPRVATVDSSAGQRQSTPAEFEKKLQKTISAGAPSNAGRVMVMDLEKVTAEFGDDWPRICGWVQNKICGFLERELAPQDFFTVNGDLSYVIVFHSLAADAAKLRIHAIANTILEKLFGEDNRLNILRIKSAVSEVDDELVFCDEDGLEAVSKVLDEADGVVADAKSLEIHRIRERMPPAVRDEIDEVRSLIERLQSQGALALSWNGSSGEFGSNRDRQPPKWIPIVWGRLEDLTAQCELLTESDPGLGALIESELAFLTRALTDIEDGQSAEQAGSPGPRNVKVTGSLGSSPKGMDVRYEPVWSVQHKAIGIYLCKTVFDYGDKVESSDDWIEADTDPRLIAGIDKIGLERVVLKFKEAGPSDVKHIHGITVHKSTLAGGASQREFLQLAHMIPPEWRGYVVWEILGIKNLEWSLRLETFSAMLRSAGKAVTVRIADDNWTNLHANLRDAKQGGLFGVGLDVSRLLSDETAIVAKAEALIEAAAANGLRTNFWNVQSKSLADRLVAAGATYISGEVVSSDLAAQ